MLGHRNLTLVGAALSNDTAIGPCMGSAATSLTTYHGSPRWDVGLDKYKIIWSSE